ncbi:MAG: hypothetical protein JNL57_06075 [Bacteroidetes bacterium]|nr:hypothetical protein [Bacteroidota bacterium]
MRFFYGIGWLVFLAANLFKLNHLPGGDLMLLFSGLLLLLHALISLFIKPRLYITLSLGYCVVAMAVWLFIWRILYWPGAWSVLFVFILFVVSYCIVGLIRSEFLKPLSGLVFILALAGFRSMFVPAHVFYRNYQMNTLFNSNYISKHYYPWYNYSWFLHLAGEKEGALKAINRAEINAEYMYQSFHEQADSINLKLIRQMKDSLAQQNWKTFNRMHL